MPISKEDVLGKIATVRKGAKRVYKKGEKAVKKYAPIAKTKVAQALKSAEEISKLMPEKQGEKIRSATKLVKDVAKVSGIELPAMAKNGNQYVVLKAGKVRKPRGRPRKIVKRV